MDTRAYQEGGIGALEHPQSKTMTRHRKKLFIAENAYSKPESPTKNG